MICFGKVCSSIRLPAAERETTLICLNTGRVNASWGSGFARILFFVFCWDVEGRTGDGWLIGQKTVLETRLVCVGSQYSGSTARLAFAVLQGRKRRCVARVACSGACLVHTPTRFDVYKERKYLLSRYHSLHTQCRRWTPVECHVHICGARSD